MEHKIPATPLSVSCRAAIVRNSFWIKLKPMGIYLPVHSRTFASADAGRSSQKQSHYPRYSLGKLHSCSGSLCLSLLFDLLCFRRLPDRSSPSATLSSGDREEIPEAARRRCSGMHEDLKGFVTHASLLLADGKLARFNLGESWR